MPEKLNKAPAYQRYPDKWLADTRRLSYEAKGIYADLIETIWLQFQDTCSIPDDPAVISSEIGCSTEEWTRARAEIMAEHRPLMVLTETNRLLSRGLWKEAEKQRERREKLRANGRKGGRPKTKRLSGENQKVILEKPNDNQNESLPTPSSSPSPSSSPPPEKKPPKPPNGGIPVAVKDAFIVMFNQTTGRNIRTVPDKAQRQISARLKDGYTMDDFETAIRNAMEDDHHKQHGYRYITPEFITRGDKLQSWLECAPKEVADPEREAFIRKMKESDKQ